MERSDGATEAETKATLFAIHFDGKLLTPKKYTDLLYDAYGMKRQSRYSLPGKRVYFSVGAARNGLRQLDPRVRNLFQGRLEIAVYGPTGETIE